MKGGLVRDYQGRINGLFNGTMTPGTASSETQSNCENLPLNSQIQRQTTIQQNGMRSQNSIILYWVLTQGSGTQQAHANYEKPITRQALFDGRSSWNSFFQSF